MTIKEKVEIKPTPTAASSRAHSGSILASDRFYHPPLFVVDQTSGKVGLPLASTLTIDGSINVGGEMGYGNQVILLDVGQFNQEHRIAWKIRATAPEGGGIDEGQTPYTGTFTSGAYPDVRLYLFDYTWWNGTRTFVNEGSALTYHFTGSLFQSMSDPLIPVTATARATGSQNSSQLFDRWRIQAPPEIVVSGGVSIPVTIRPLNAGGGVHLPWGIPLSEAEMMVSVDCDGEYVYLGFGSSSGQEITMPLGFVISGRTYWNSPRFLYDPTKGMFEAASKTVNISVTGGGVTTTVPVKLTKVTTCAHVVFAKSTLHTGETTTLEITKEDGSPIGPTEALDIDIMAGAGTLEASGKSGTSLSNVRAPVTYIAPESIEGDSLVVKVAAYSYFAGEAGASASSASAAVTPALNKTGAGLSTQSVSGQSDQATRDRMGKLVADNVCTAGNTVVKNGKRIPTSITLDVDPTEPISPWPANLKVTLKDGKGKIEPNETDATIDFSLGEEVEKYGELKSIDPASTAMTLVSVGYGSSVVVAFSKVPYDGCFPLRFYVSAGVHGKEQLRDTKVLTLFGLNTAGKYFKQNGSDWADDIYDTYRRLTYDKTADSVDVSGNPVFWTIADKGCALTCMAMVLKAFGCDIDPGKLNEWMTDPQNDAFDEDGNVDWQRTLFNYPGSTIGSSRPINEDKPFPAPTTALEYNLSQGYPSIVQFRNPDTGNMHWAVVTGKTLSGQYTILDPGSSSRVLLDPSKIYKYREIISQ